MKSRFGSFRAPLFLGLIVCLVSRPSSLAQGPDRDVDHLAKRLSMEIAKAGIGSVVVADFLNTDGTTLREGFYLAEELSERLEHHKKHFAVLDRRRLSSALSNAHLSTKDLTSVDALRSVWDSLQTDGVVTGTVEVLPGQYSLNLSLRSLKDGSVVASESQSVKRPGYADTFLFLYSGGPNETIRKPGVDGVSIPTCEACPPPTYTDKARAAKIQGNVQLLVVINQEGRPVRIEVTRSSDDGLARKAIEAVRNWKFRPATDKEGHAVAVIVPIEVTFRLY